MAKIVDRRKTLLEHLSEHGYATVEDLARRFGVTSQTIRKDIGTLAKQGVVQRLHGGACTTLGSENIVYEQRKALYAEEKQRIGRLVAEHVPDGASLFINIGTTTEEVAQALLQHKGLRIVTNSLNVATLCARNPTHDVVVAGGKVRQRDNGIIGTSTEKFIREFRVDYGIVGISGIDEDGNLLDYDYREVAVARSIIECSRHVYVATDSSKFGRPAMVRVGSLSDVTSLFTNGPLQPRWEKMVRDSGVDLFLA